MFSSIQYGIMYNNKINSNFSLLVTNVNKLLACEIENLIGIDII